MLPRLQKETRKIIIYGFFSTSWKTENKKWKIWKTENLKMFNKKCYEVGKACFNGFSSKNKLPIHAKCFESRNHSKNLFSISRATIWKILETLKASISGILQSHPTAFSTKAKNNARIFLKSFSNSYDNIIAIIDFLRNH